MLPGVCGLGSRGLLTSVKGFTDNFNTPDGQALGIRSQWKLEFGGSDRLTIRNNLLYVSNNYKGSFFSRGSNADTAQTVQANMYPWLQGQTNDTTGGLVCFGSGSDISSFNGIVLNFYSRSYYQEDDGSTTVEVATSIDAYYNQGYRNNMYDNSVYYNYNTNPPPENKLFKLIVTRTSSTTLGVQAFANGTSFYSGTTAASLGMTSPGKRGLYVSKYATSNVPFSDNYVDDGLV